MLAVYHYHCTTFVIAQSCPLESKICILWVLRIVFHNRFLSPYVFLFSSWTTFVYEWLMMAFLMGSPIARQRESSFLWLSSTCIIEGCCRATEPPSQCVEFLRMYTLGSGFLVWTLLAGIVLARSSDSVLWWTSRRCFAVRSDIGNTIWFRWQKASSTKHTYNFHCCALAPLKAVDWGSISRSNS